MLDLARELPESHAVAMLDSALHQGLVSRPALARRVGRLQGRDTLELRRAHDRVIRPDLAWPELRLVVEADGFEFHAYRRDRRRLNALTVQRWRVLRFAWEDVVGQPDQVVRSVRALIA